MTFHNRYTFFVDLCVQGHSNKNKKHKTYFKICVLDYFLNYNRQICLGYVYMDKSFVFIYLNWIAQLINTLL